VSFEIFMGEPEMLFLWKSLVEKAEADTLNEDEQPWAGGQPFTYDLLVSFWSGAGRLSELSEHF
jgi:hypothetical protein